MSEAQERIVIKAHELFMRYGIRSVSMDEVANHLGISKKTIYQFFADKDALVEGVIDMEIRRNQGECSQQNLQSENPIHEMFLAVDMVLEILSKINPNVLFDLEKYHPRAFKKHNDFKNQFLFNIIKKNIEQGMAEGLYREDVNADIMARFRLASTFLLFSQEHFPMGKHSPASVLTEITYNFLFGLVTPKGAKLVQKYKQQRSKTISV